MLFEMARMSSEDGLVMQLHPGVLRDHDRAVAALRGPDVGYDIPVPTEYVRTTSGVPSASASIDLLPLSTASAGIAASAVHSAPDDGAVVGAIVAGDVITGGLVSVGSVLGAGGAVEPGAAAAVVGGTLDVLVVVDVVVEVDDVATVIGVETSGLDSWSSRAQALAKTVNRAAAAHDVRTSEVSHAASSRVVATPLVEPRSDREHRAPDGEHDSDVLQIVRCHGHQQEADQGRTEQEHCPPIHPTPRRLDPHDSNARIQ
jgi:hypothetical protein